MPVPDNFALDSSSESTIHINDADVVATLNLVAPQAVNPEESAQITFDLVNNRATDALIMYQVTVNGSVVKESEQTTLAPAAVASQVENLPPFAKTDRGTDAIVIVNTYRQVTDTPTTETQRRR